MTRFKYDEAASHPEVIELGAGTYHWCQCGKTRTVPYCDGSHEGSGVQPLAFAVAEPITSAICNCGLTANPPYCSGAHVDIE
jgi:CDGSH iron-sulfur domain-containing protein 3